MLTIEALRAWGANVNEGVARCVNNEAFYLRMVQKVVADQASVDALKAAVASDDRKAGFEAAHKLKGVLANLSLTPVLDPTVELTELLRGNGEGDPLPLLEKVLAAFEELKNL